MTHQRLTPANTLETFQRLSNDQEPLNTGIVHALPERLLTDRAYLLGRLGREARRQFTQVLSAWELHPLSLWDSASS